MERDRLLKDINYFVTDIYGKQKELDVEVYVESLPKNVFKKKYYSDHIKEYRRLKEMALKIDTDSYDLDPDDEELLELYVMFEETLALYNLYCERGLEVQDFLKRKAEKQDVLRSEYLASTRRQQSTAMNFSKSLNDLTAAYVDYTQRIGYEE